VPNPLPQLPKGMPKPPTNNVVANISQSVHLRQLSMAFLKSVEKKRIRRPPKPQDLANFLWGGMEGASTNEYTDISNIWTCLRSTMWRLKINVFWVDDDKMTLHLNGLVLWRGVAEYTLHNSICEYYCQNF